MLFFKKRERFITQTVYTGCTRISYKIVPATNFNKYGIHATAHHSVADEDSDLWCMMSCRLLNNDVL
jgi:hypothetical protein